MRYESISVPKDLAHKLRAASVATRVPKTEIFRQLLTAERIDAWVDAFVRDQPSKDLCE